MPVTRRTTADIAAEWRTLVEGPYRWIRSANQAGASSHYVEGESAGFFVKSDSLPGRRAYLKPRVQDLMHAYSRAAREKIASDLAAEVGVCVPPVVLSRRFDGGGEENYVCVSLLMFEVQWSWGHVRGLLTRSPGLAALEPIVRALPGASARGLAFDTWVGQGDHNDHPSNIMWGYDAESESAGAFVFLDFAMAMGVKGAWEKQAYRNCTAAPFPPYMLENIDKTVLAETVSQIEAVSPDTIRNLVGRIPASHLPREKGDIIAEGLVERRNLIRSALAPHLEERHP